MRRLRLVVCEDADDTRELLVDALEREGHEVTAVADGRSAIAAIARLAPDAAVIDVGMPGMSGYEVVRAIRRAAGRHQPRLVAVTGYGSEADRAEAFAAGFDAHLTKPATLHDLLAALAGTT